MKPFGKVAIVGVGLIGGSIGLALRRRNLAEEVIGIGRRPASLRKARKRGTVTRTTTDVARGVRGAHMVVVCTPVGTVVDRVRAVVAAAAAGTLITDAASTKGAIVAAVEAHLAAEIGRRATGIRFVGSHPLAGDHRTGPEHAQADLFAGRTVVVTPTRTTRTEDVAAVDRFWSSLGARVLTMTPQDHDRVLAATSHLPHLVASAMAASTAEADLPLVASGWRDATRIAAGDPRLWREILLSNRQHVLASLSRLEKTMASMRRALEQNRPQPLEQLLARGKKNRDAVGS